MENNKKKITSISIDPELEKQVKYACKQIGIPVSQIVCQLLERWLEDEAQTSP